MSGRQVIERVFSAPIERVWQLWTSAEGIASWYGPRGFEVTVDALELKVGGAFTYTMRAVDPEMAARMKSAGRPEAFSVAATITHCEAPTRFAYDSPYGDETLITDATFSETDAGVKLVLVIDATKPDMTTGAARGFNSSLDRFAEQLG